MGITVVSSAKLPAGGNATGAPQPAADSGADFSALLGLQLTSPQLPSLALQADSALQADKKGSADDNSSAQDPASLLASSGLLAAMLGTNNPNIPNVPKADAGDGKAAAIGESDAGEAKGSLPEMGASGLLEQKAGAMGSADVASKALQESLSRTTNPALSDAAKFAADGQSGANNASNFAATLAAHAAAHPAQSQNETAAAAPQISVPLQDSRWAQDFSEKVVWLAKNDQQTAQITINPPQLGPMHITLNLSGDQASAIFVSPHAEVRQAIEDAMPQLREMLAGAGIDLGQANVGTQLPQQNSGTPQQFSDSRRFNSDNAILHGDNGHGISATSVPQPVRSGRGMVDLFA